MRLASFRHDGQDSFGVVEGDRIIDCGPTAGSRFAGLRQALAADALDEVAAKAASDGFPLTAVELLPPIVDSQKILCIGLNYRKHAEEAGMAIPNHPSIFVRFPNSQVGHEQAVVKPFLSDHYDYEGELAVIIGKRARHVPEDQALSVVAGYACFGEHSVRDYQRHAAQATPGKNFTASGGFGPWLVTPDEVGDPNDLMLRTRVNGVEQQCESTADMIFSVQQLIAYITSFTELLPGDVIVTGTPSGVGFVKKPPLYLKDGDVVEVEIEKVGLLRNPVVAEADPRKS